MTTTNTPERGRIVSPDHAEPPAPRQGQGDAYAEEPEDVGVQLPYDFHRGTSSAVRLEKYEFALIWPSGVDADPDVPGTDPGGAPLRNVILAGSFAILLARYSGQPSITLLERQLTAGGEVRWAGPSRVPTGLDVAVEEVFAAVERSHGRARGNGTASRRDGRAGIAESSRAGFTWIESEGSPEGEAAGSGGHDGGRAASQATNLAPGIDLHLFARSSGRRIHATFLFDANLFKRSTIERCASHLSTLVSNLPVSASVPVGVLTLVSRPERAWIEAACTGVVADRRLGHVHELVESWAARSPSAVAVRYAGALLTYGELNARANILARRLGAEGVGAASRVVVAVAPSFDVVVCLLAILKAGAVYVPLDPTSPAARLRTMLDETRPAIVLTRGTLLQTAAVRSDPILPLEQVFRAPLSRTLEQIDAASELDGPLAANLDVRIAASQPAYVYFTSGTTGTPKGVVGTYENLANSMSAARERYGLREGDAIPAVARFTFSISMFELMSPLAAGATLVVLDRDHVIDLRRLAATLREVSFFHAGPSLLKSLVSHLRLEEAPGAFSNVRHVSSGGDMVPPELLVSLREIFTEAEVFVIYGCSEIGCMGCTYPVPRAGPLGGHLVGRAFENVVVRILDGALNVVPVGAVGEIHFGGPTIAAGYLDQPELTDEKFVQIGGRRFYRTGDVGRLTEEGFIEILGRRDFQIKVRGMRVELGEIEAHLRRAPGVRDGVVVASESPTGETEIVAYVVPEGATELADFQAVRRFLSTWLPDYMMPAVFVALGRLPLNANMKVDRRALPRPDAADRRRLLRREARPPMSATEKELATMWAGLLRIESVGLDDNFFELGGHSLLAARLMVEVEKVMGVTLDAMDVLREPLSILASLCDQARKLEPLRPGAGAPQSPEAASWIGSPESRVETFHFGSGKELYGVFHPTVPSEGRARRGVERAVLICGPVGQEALRSQFVLGLLGKQLAAAGIPALQFDYFGCGDSLGDSAVEGCERWIDDIRAAAAELVRRTGTRRIVAVGVRLGATLLTCAVPADGVSRLVLWDPVADGAAYHLEAVALHRRYMRGLVRPAFNLGEMIRGVLGRGDRAAGAEELVGLRFSGAAISELRALRLAPSLLPTAALTSQAPRGAASPGAAVDFDSAWDDVTRLEDILPDVGFSRALQAMIEGAQ